MPKDRTRMMEEIKDVGDPMEKFRRGDRPADDQISQQERIMWFRRKRIVPVVIEIRVNGPIPMTILQDTFNIYVGDEKIGDNTKLMQDKMQLFSEQIRKLVETWTVEMR